MKAYFSVTNDVVSDQRVIKIVRSLRKINIDSIIIGRIHNKSIEIPNSLNDIKIIRFKTIFKKGPLFYAEFNIRLFIFFLTHNFDILVANDLDTLLPNFLASKLKSKILIYDSHELFTEVPELTNRKLIKFIWLTIEKCILPKIKYSYTVSSAIAKYYNIKYGIKMNVIRNIAPYKEKNNSIIKKNVILYQGAVNKGRGLENIIKAMKYIENFELHIIGDGDIIEELKTLVNKENLNNKVFFIKRMPFDKLEKYTQEAKLGISLEEKIGYNYYFALPNKLFNYIQARTPVMVSNFPEMTKIVKTYNVGITVDNHTPEILAETIKNIINNNDTYNKWLNNLDHAAKELCWENEEKKLLTFFSSIIEKQQDIALKKYSKVHYIK